MQIIVLGMHRSGTSTLARILNLMGCYFGTEDVMTSSASDNPKGFWERIDVMEVNDLILGFAGGSWWEVDLLDFKNISHKKRELIDKQIRDIVIKIDLHRPWFIKDPRMCLTLNFWLPHLEETIFVLALRSPLQIARSLHQRNNIPLEYGLGLWEFYMYAMLKNINSMNYIPVRYDAVIQNPYRTSLDLHTALTKSGVSGLIKPDKTKIEAFVDSSLRHFNDDFDLSLSKESHLRLWETLNTREPIQPSPKRIANLLEEMRHIKADDKWTLTLPEPSSLETLLRRLKQFEKENRRLLEENNMHKKNYFNLEVEYLGIREEYWELEKKRDELESEINTLNGKLNQTTIQYEHIINRLNIRLQAISHSRLVRILALLTRFVGLGKSGLNAELKRIENLLNPDQGKKWKKVPNLKNAILLINLLRHTLKYPNNTLQLMKTTGIKNALNLFSDSSGDLDLFLKQCEEFHFQPYAALKQTIIEPFIGLLWQYRLPVSSTAKRPCLPTDQEVFEWRNLLHKLAEKVRTSVENPTVSIIIPAYNQIRFTLACLHSIYLNVAGYDYEIIISDDNSSDQTPKIFKNFFPNVRYLRNQNNLGFLGNCNQAAKSARGQYLIFLNNDTVVMNGWLEEIIKTFEIDPAIGLVGSKLIYPEGALQEAGSIIFEDGNGWNFGRFQDPTAPLYNYMREVDYCSGASIAITAKLWHQLGGFDEFFSPAYYEDTDLAFQVRAANKRVVYQPLSQVIHFEGISSGKSERSGIKRYQAINRPKFQKKWEPVLVSHGSCMPSILPYLRKNKGDIVFIDATTPTPDKDSGSIDAFNYMRILKDLGFHVIFIPEDLTFHGDYTIALQRIGIECLHFPWISSINEAIVKYGPKTRIFILCRVDVARPLIADIRQHVPNARILFDTVDLHFLREERESVLLASSDSTEKAKLTRYKEISVIKKSDATILRSTYEKEMLEALMPDHRFFNIPIVRDLPQLSSLAWKHLRDIVFIGGFSHPPNIDAVKYFIAEVWPILRNNGFSGKFVVAGSHIPDEIKALATKDIIIRGFVPDLSDLFGKCRISVAPLRYGAGMKGKVITSLSYGIPCVASEIAVEGTGLAHGRNIMVSRNEKDMAQMIQKLYFDQKLWTKISEAGLQYCREVVSIEAVKQKLDHMIAKLLNT